MAMVDLALEIENIEQTGSEPRPESEPREPSVSKTRKADIDRGYREAETAIACLAAKWPEAFPANPFKVRPLAMGIVDSVSVEMGWTKHYTQGVMKVWKMRAAYCNAVLSHFNRYALDGSLAEPIDDQARQFAREAIAKMNARRRQASTSVAPPPTQSPAPTEPTASIVVEGPAPRPKVESKPSSSKVAHKQAKASSHAAAPATAASKRQSRAPAVSSIAAAKAAAAAAAEEKDRAFRAKMVELVAKRRLTARK